MTLIHGLGVGRSSKASSAKDPGTEMEQQAPSPHTHLLYSKLTSSGNFITFLERTEKTQLTSLSSSFGTCFKVWRGQGLAGWNRTWCQQTATVEGKQSFSEKHKTQSLEGVRSRISLFQGGMIWEGTMEDFSCKCRALNPPSSTAADWHGQSFPSVGLRRQGLVIWYLLPAQEGVAVDVVHDGAV